MGARQSKRSVDISVTPKKGGELENGAVATNVEEKLEKIAEADSAAAKVNANGSTTTTSTVTAEQQVRIMLKILPICVYPHLPSTRNHSTSPYRGQLDIARINFQDNDTGDLTVLSVVPEMTPTSRQYFVSRKQVIV